MADEFVEALLIAGKAHLRPDSSFDAAILAVACVALERAAEVVRNKGRKWHGDLDENKSLDDLADDILALIPPEKEPT